MKGTSSTTMEHARDNTNAHAYAKDGKEECVNTGCLLVFEL